MYGNHFIAGVLVERNVFFFLFFLHLLDLQNGICCWAPAKICQTHLLRDESSGSFGRLGIQGRAGWISSETLSAVGGWERAGWIYCWRSAQQRSERIALRAREKHKWRLNYLPLSSSALVTRLSLCLPSANANNVVNISCKLRRLCFCIFWIKKEESYFCTGSPWHALVWNCAI